MNNKGNRFQEYYKQLYGNADRLKSSFSDLHKTIIIVSKRRYSKPAQQEALCLSEGLSKETATMTLTSMVFETNNAYRLQQTQC